MPARQLAVLLLERFGFSDGTWPFMIEAVRFVFSLVEAPGYGMLILAVLQALRQLRDASSGTAADQTPP